MSGSFLVLHGLAIKKFGSAAAVATVIGGDEAAVADALAQAVAAGDAHSRTPMAAARASMADSSAIMRRVLSIISAAVRSARMAA